MSTKIEDLDFGKLPRPANGQSHIAFGSRDSQGLQFVIKSSGRKEFRFRYVRPEDGRRTTYTIGTFPEINDIEAKKELKRLKGELAKGLNPTASKHRAQAIQIQSAIKAASITGHQFSFTQLAENFLDHCKRTGKPNARTLAKYRTGLIFHLLPELGAWDMRYFSVPDYKEIIFRIAKKSHAVAYSVHASMRRLFSWAVDSGRLNYNPLLGLKDILKAVEIEPRNRYLSPHEIHRFLNELPHQPINDDTKLALLIQIHTGLRIGEICSLEWDKIDFRGRLITHPQSVMKSGKKAETVMSDAVFRLLAERRKATLSESGNRVFPNGFNTDHVVAQMRSLKGWIDFGTHDLRRTVSTYLQEFGCPLDVREKITNHAEPKGVRRSYDHSKALKQQLTWLNLLGAKLAEIKVNPSAVDIGIGLDDSDPLMAEFADIL